MPVHGHVTLGVYVAELLLFRLLYLCLTSSLCLGEQEEDGMEAGSWGLQRRGPPCLCEPWSGAENLVEGGLSSPLSELRPV